eukprot:gene33150-42873_t
MERIPSPQMTCGGNFSIPSYCPIPIDNVSDSFFNNVVHMNASLPDINYLVGMYRAHEYTVIGRTTSSSRVANFTSIIAYNNRTNDLAVVIHDVNWRSGLVSNDYNFYYHYHYSSARNETNQLVDYIFGMRELNATTVTVVARAEHGNMAQWITRYLYDDVCRMVGCKCVRSLAICGNGADNNNCDSGLNKTVNESFAEFDRSFVNFNTHINHHYIFLPKDIFYITTSSKWGYNETVTKEVSEHIVYGEIALFVDDVTKSSTSVAYRENFFECKQTFKAIVESFFPGYEYWNELRGFAAEKESNLVQGIVLFHESKSQVLIVMRPALEELLTRADNGLHRLDEYFRNGLYPMFRASRRLLQYYRRTGIKKGSPQRSLRSACWAVLDLLAGKQNITVTVTGHSTGAAMALIVALDLAEAIADYRHTYAAINAVEVVSFALPPVVGNRALAFWVKFLNVSHVHYYNAEDDAVVKSNPQYEFNANMSQVARPLSMNLDKTNAVRKFSIMGLVHNANYAKNQKAAHRLDTILFNMAKLVDNTTRRPPPNLMTDFDPVETDIGQGKCEDFSKYVSDVFCKDYENARGKKCDSNAKIGPEEDNDFKNFLEKKFALNFQTLCDSNEKFCSDWIGKLLKAVDSLEVFYDVITTVLEIIDSLFAGKESKIFTLLTGGKQSKIDNWDERNGRGRGTNTLTTRYKSLFH